jgi:response regulator PhyR-like protein
MGSNFFSQLLRIPLLYVRNSKSVYTSRPTFTVQTHDWQEVTSFYQAEIYCTSQGYIAPPILPHQLCPAPAGSNPRMGVSMTELNRLIEAQIPRLRRYARALTRDVIRADDLVQTC